MGWENDWSCRLVVNIGGHEMQRSLSLVEYFDMTIRWLPTADRLWRVRGSPCLAAGVSVMGDKDTEPSIGVHCIVLRDLADWGHWGGWGTRLGARPSSGAAYHGALQVAIRSPTDGTCRRWLLWRFVQDVGRRYVLRWSGIRPRTNRTRMHATCRSNVDST